MLKTLMKTLKRIVLAALNPIRFFFRFRPCLSNHLQIGIGAAAAAAMLGGFLLLCACAGQAYPTAATAGTPVSTKSAVPTSANTSLPGPSPSILPANQSPAPSPTPAGHNSSPADLAIRGPETLQTAPGETAVYTLTVRNDGPALATGIVLTDALPGGLVPVWTRPPQVTCRRQGRSVGCDVGDLSANDAITATLDLSVGGAETLADGQLAGVTFSTPWCIIEPDSDRPLVTCHLPHLPPGTEAQVRIGFTADTPLAETRVHTAVVAANEPDPDRSNNRTSLAVTVAANEQGGSSTDDRPPAPDLVLRAEEPASIIAGRPFTRTFTIHNAGSLTATGVYFESALPPATTLTAYAPGLPLCERQGDAFVCTLRDPDSGKAITFTLLVTGYGEQPVVIELDALAPGWPVCTVLKERSFLHILTCELGALKPGQTTRVQMTLTAGGVQKRAMVHTASVSANEADRNPLDDSDTTTMTVQARADLWVRSQVSGPALAGETLRYTLTIANAGPSDADGVVLVDTLPVPVGRPGAAGASLVSADPGPGKSCQIEEGGDAAAPAALTCNLGRLDSGETATVTIVVAIGESLTQTATETMVHTARVTSDQTDPDPANNALTETIPVGDGGQE